APATPDIYRLSLHDALPIFDHIGTSSTVLLAIVNDILDLATVDAGIMQLDIEDVAIADEIDAAAKRVKERLQEHDLSLNVNLARSEEHTSELQSRENLVCRP